MSIKVRCCLKYFIITPERDSSYGIGELRKSLSDTVRLEGKFYCDANHISGIRGAWSVSRSRQQQYEPVNNIRKDDHSLLV